MIYYGDCLDVLKSMDENSIDSMVTDPPAGISFMGKEWDDGFDFRTRMTIIFQDCKRVLKPGAHALVWAIPRTSHWTASALEMAGFEIRDVITHVFGSGFPKSLDISKAIDKAAGATREVIGKKDRTDNAGMKGNALCSGKYERVHLDITAAATLEAKRWQGFGTALKPASEHWILARKPLSEKTVAANVLKWGTGGINIDKCRIEAVRPAQNYTAPDITGNNYNRAEGRTHMISQPANLGRFPANFVLSHNEDCEDKCTPGCAVKMLDEQSLSNGIHGAGKARSKQLHKGDFGINEHGERERLADNRFGDSGGASRFFYCAKASKSERNLGCEGLPKRIASVGDVDANTGRDATNPNNAIGGSKKRIERGLPPTEPRANTHPTVKPLKLMRYLCRLITPPNGIILDPFMGSGSTGIAALQEGFQFIGIEREQEYLKIAEARLDYVRSLNGE